MQPIDISMLPPEFYSWVEEHLGDNPQRLRLSWRGRQPWIEFAVTQIECRRRVAKKLAAEVAEPRFLFPTELSAQQSTSDTLARFHASLVEGESRIVDLTSGLGIDAMMLARVADSVVGIDIDSLKSDTLRHNAAVFGIDNLETISIDCREYIASQPDRSIDVAFIDPARRADDGSRLFSLQQCQPDVVEMLPQLSRVCRRLVVKMSPMLDVSQTLRELPLTTDIYVLGAVNECKELLAVVDFSATIDVKPHVHVVSPDAEWPSFTFTLDEEASSAIECAIPKVGEWLYEPAAPTMKAAPWGVLCSRFGLKRLQANTNLYVAASDDVLDFPGTVWRISAIVPFSSSEAKRFSSRWPRINVAVRNFPMTADALRRKLRVNSRPDDTMKVVGVTVADGSRLLLVLTK